MLLNESTLLFDPSATTMFSACLRTNLLGFSFRFLALLLHSTGERIRIAYGTLRRWSSYGCNVIEGLLFNNSFMYRMTWVSACVPHIFQRHTSTANAPSSFSLLSSSNQNGAVAKKVSGWVQGNTIHPGNTRHPLSKRKHKPVPFQVVEARNATAPLR